MVKSAPPPISDNTESTDDEVTAPTKPVTLHDIMQGTAVALAFIGVATVSYFIPKYFGFPQIGLIVTIFCFIIGVAGLGLELNKLGGENRKLGLDNLGIGVFCGLVWAVLYHFFPIGWIDGVTTILLLVGFYGAALGTLEFANSLLTAGTSRSVTFTKVAIFVVQAVTFIFTVLALVQLVRTWK